MTELTPSAPRQTPPDVGSILRQTRLSRGQSIEAVFQHTRIPKKFIEALESNHFEVFPASVYLHGFLKTYCDYLELAFDPLWAQIAPPPKIEANQTQTLDTAQGTERPAAAGDRDSGSRQATRPAPTSAQSVRAHDSSTGGSQRLDSSFSPTIPLLVLGGLLVLGAATLLFKAPSRRASVPPPVQSANRLPAAVAPLHSHEPMALKIIFRREAWVRLYADGRLRFEGRAPAGYAQEWGASDNFILRTSKPQDVELTLDGRPYPLDSARPTSSGDYKIVRTQ